MYSIDDAYAICNATSDSGYLLEEQVIKIKYKDFDCTDSILVAIKINIWTNFKIGLSLQKICFICFNEIPLQMMNNAFYFILKVLFIFMTFEFLSWLFGYLGKSARL